MLTNSYTLIGLIVSAVLDVIVLAFVSKNQKQTRLRKSFMGLLTCLLICSIGLISQIIFSKRYNINPIYFEYFVYIGTCFLSVSFLIMSLFFSNPSINLNTKSLIIKLSIIPIICLIALWTNDFHHLFYIEYSTVLSQGVYGPFFYITCGYTYLLLGIGLIIIGIYAIKNIKFYFIQSILIFIGTLVPVIVNSLGIIGVFDLSIYITPMCFSITFLLYALSVFRFGFLKITPVTLKNIVNKISDSYIVLNNNMIIADFNDTLLSTFNVKNEDIIDKSLFSISGSFEDFKRISDKIISAIKQFHNTDKTVVLEEYFRNIDKYFHIEINQIIEKGSPLGTLILLKDITQHQLDLQTIKNSQNILIERERLATLGQMIGGIAHNLKTPIMSIAGASEGLLDLIQEYSDSIGDPEVTKEDHLEIANDMRTWITKIQSHISYMSDVITTVKGQAVAFSDTTSFIDFTIEDLIRQINILMKHELNNALIELEEDIRIPDSTTIKGNVNSLVQTINNIISNAIQAYNGKTGEKIILSIYKYHNNTLVISIQDFAGGLPNNVKEKLFKEMITTKGKDGTGLGLFMSYSNIKAHFNGNIRFDSITGKGTTFYIEIPI